MPFNPRTKSRPLPLALIGHYKYALITLRSKDNSDAALSIVLAPLSSYAMQCKIGYLVSWAVAMGYETRITHLTQSQAVGWLPEKYTKLPRRNLCIVTAGECLEAYAQHIKTSGLDIPAEITHHDDED